MATITNLTDFASGLLNLLSRRAKAEPDREIFKFLSGEGEVSSITCEQLYRRACCVAFQLRQHAATGERVLLLYPPGLDYIVSFFGCLYAGLIAVPSYPPARAIKDISRSSVWSIAADARPAVVMASAKILQRLISVKEQFSGSALWIAPDLTDESRHEEWQPLSSEADAVAYLQYTSGSTSTPRGVMVSHGNLVHNAERIHSAFGLSPELTGVFWLPPYHDMGLIGGILQPVFSGFNAVLMSPGDFIQRPMLWLETISKFRAAVSGGPNFAYDLCVRRFNPEETKTLDLSCWRVAFNGAEPVRGETLRKFNATFSRYGFQQAAFQPCYGLAEATLLVSGRKKAALPAVLSLDSNALAQDKVKIEEGRESSSVFVGCGLAEGSVDIVKPDSSRRCDTGEIGEILVTGPCVAQGYWHKPEESESVFRAHVEGSKHVFLRTGDLGFIHQGELFVTGRLKDLIIIRGRNYYPVDIEETVRASIPAFADKACAAMSLEVEGETHLLVLQECPRRGQVDAEQAFSTMRMAVAFAYQLQIHTIALVMQGALPKTTSGKIQRSLCLKQFLEGTLSLIASSTLGRGEEELLFSSLEDSSQSEDQNQIVTALVELIARKLGVAKSHIDPRLPLETFGLDSLLSIQIAMEVEGRFGAVLPPATFLESLSIQEAALRLGSVAGEKPEPGATFESREFPLSQGQRALWFLQQLAPTASAYNICRAFRLKGKGLAERLQSAIEQSVSRHPSLRVRFTSVGRESAQHFDSSAPLNFEVVDGSSWNDQYLEQELVDRSRRPFSLEFDAPLRVTWIQQQEEAGVLLIVVHHIVADRWSLEILLEDVAALCATGGKFATLLPPGQISAYLDWQSKFLAGAESGRFKSYWEEKLGGELPIVNLATGLRPRTQTFNGARLSVPFEQAPAHRFADLAKQENVTLFVLLLAAFDALLYRYTGKADLPVGIPVAGRSRAAHARIVGYLVNPVVIRANVSGDPTFRDFYRQIRHLVIEGVNHADYPFPLLAQHLQSDRDPSFPPLFQLMFYSESTGRVDEAFRLAGIEAQTVEIPFHPAQFDLTLSIEESSGLPLAASFDYNTDLFDQAAIRRMAEHFKVLLSDLAANPGLNLSQAALLTKMEQEQLLRDWSGGSFEGPPVCVHQLIEAQVERSPEAEAVIYGEERFNYRELNRRANCLAWELSGAGAAPEKRVAVCSERSSDLIVALLATLKSGAAYVPLDPAYPPEFLSLILRESKADILLTQEALRTRFPAQSAPQVVCIEKCDFGKDVPAPKTAVVPGNLAYIIFTSGSTGTPKGVAIEHRNCAAFLRCAPDVYPLTARDVVLFATSICFDISIIEIFLTLTRGAAVAIAFNVLELPTLPARNEVTLIDTVPSGMSQLLSQGPLPARVSVVSLGGEALSSEVVKRAYASGVDKVINIYGPTEDTTFSTFECVPPEEVGEPTIGRPLRGKHTYILDAAMNLCPVGVAGEVYVGGTGVVRGYWNQPALTAERFLPNPFAQAPGSRLYRVGDLGRWREDGRLEYLGRVDFQVKVRGFRIELGNIESALRAHDAVQQAVVVVHQRRDADKQLIAYVVLKGHVAAQDLRGFVRERLPEHMIPARILELETLPLSPNGKINRKALPDPDSLVREEEEFAPVRGGTEQALAAIWAEVLGLEVSDRQANFFDSGGHSLLATQVMSRIRQVFSIDLPLRMIFEEPTLGGLSAHIDRLRAQTGSGRGSALAPRKRPERIPLSHAQQRMWFLEQMQPGDPTYVIASAIRLFGPLDVEALKISIQQVVERHETLRTRIEMQDGVPHQVISASLQLEFPISSLTGLEKEQRQAEADRQMQQMVDTPFDLERGPVIRVRLWKLGEQENCLGITIHHVAADGWSMGVLFREIKHFYESLVTGAQHSLPMLPVQYADYAIWQRKWLQVEELHRQLEYWRGQLQDISGLRLPIDRPYPSVRSGYGSTYRWILPSSLISSLRFLGRKEGVTVFMTMLAAFQALLARYNGNGDIPTGSVIANRNRQEIENLIGFFVNTVVLRTFVQNQQSFEKLLPVVRRVCLEAYAHQDLPFEKLVEALQPERDLGRQPFFQALLALQNAPLPEMEMAGVKLNPVAIDTLRSRFDLTLMVEPLGDSWTVVTEYNTDIFDSTTIERISGHYRRILEQVVVAPGTRLSELSILDENEERQLLAWSGGHQPCEEGIYLHQFFEKQAARTPHREALVFGEERLSYAELNQRANQLAHYLRALGARPEMVVGLCVERSVNMVVGMLAILKTGAVYLPLEPAYPEERLKYMIEDANAQIVLTQGSLEQHLSGTAQIVVLEEVAEIASQPEENPAPLAGADPENLAYIIYTSGSTGRPKGVGVSHRSVCPLLAWGVKNVPLTPDDRVLQYLAFGFDWTIWEVMVTIAFGASLYGMAEKSHLMTERIIQENRITTLHATPTEVEILAANGFVFPSLRMVMVGGEKSDWYTLECIGKLAGEDCLVIDMYGPTEAAIVTVVDTFRPTQAKSHEKHENVPIGFPVADTTCFVLDPDLNLCAQGVIGELYLGGIELARGYLNQSALTAERFIPGRFGKSAGARLYKTGDLSRWRVDGRLDYLGRADHQVKVRGFRIELGEIESVLRSHPAVREAAVMVNERKLGDKRLIAYVAADTRNSQELRTFLRERLPEYMVPSQFVEMDSLPLNPNGKVNRKALPEPPSVEAGEEKALLRTATEEMVATLWSSVLGSEVTSREANFFELGGHSLLATQVVSRIRQIFGVELPLRTFFEEATLAQLSARIDRMRQQGGELKAPKLTVGRRPEIIPLSYAQQRLWFLEQIEPGGPVYVILAAVRLTGRLELGALTRSLSHLVKRHEVLRTQIAIKEGMPCQEILDEADLQLEQIDLSGVEPEQRQAEGRARLQQLSREGFDLARAPLLRTRLLKIADEEHWLVLSMHHIASDGWSMGVLLRELKEFYQAEASGRSTLLEPLAVQYADYACWQREWLQAGELNRQLEYWRAQLQGLEDLWLPLDRPYPPVRTGHGASYRWKMPELLCAEIKDLSRRQGATYFMVLLAGLQALLVRYSGQNDIVIGTVIANRNRQEVEDLIGFFANTLLLRKEISVKESLGQLIAAARDTSLQAYAHQDLPFEKLVEALQPDRDLRRQPLVQVMLAFQNAPLPELELGELKLEPLDVESERARFDFTIEIQPIADGWRVAMEYNTDIFDGTTIERFSAHYRHLLKAAVANPEVPVSELEILTEEERYQLEGWSGSATQYNTELPLHELFQVISDPAHSTPEVLSPASGIRLYVLDSHGKMVPIGAPGEIYAGGDSMVRGYAGSPQLTAEKFIPDWLSGTPGARLYKSGELARWRTNGILEPLGRVDRQLEIRGVCFDPADVESALCRHATIREVAVLARPNQEGQKRLIAYAVPSGNLRPDLAELQTYLEKHLAAAMIPEALVWLESLPVTKKGKLDLRALPDPEVAAQKSLGLVPPRNPAETRIAGIWSEVLGRTGFGVFDNFFDVGGTSLQVVLVVSKLRQAFSQQIPVTTLFAYPTIASMAEYLGSEKPMAAAASSETVDSRKQAIQQQQELRLRARSRGTEGTM